MHSGTIIFLEEWGLSRSEKRYRGRLNLTTGSVFPYECARNSNVTIYTTCWNATFFLSFRNSIECRNIVPGQCRSILVQNGQLWSISALLARYRPDSLVLLGSHWHPFSVSSSTLSNTRTSGLCTYWTSTKLVLKISICWTSSRRTQCPSSKNTFLDMLCTSIGCPQSPSLVSGIVYVLCLVKLGCCAKFCWDVLRHFVQPSYIYGFKFLFRT